MKKMFVLLSSLSFYIIACSQVVKEQDVPAAAKAKFFSLYPVIKNVKWEKERDKYEAEFKQDDAETSVLITAGGILVQTEIEIAVSSLPQAARDYVTKNLGRKPVREASRITDTTGTITYKAEVANEDYLFDANGNFIKKETDDQEGGDNED
jgi:putative PepSY-like beta-lactamase-inhibitor